ncbi:MAG: DGQHR domain-containing protein [Actinomycetota bacterium]|nr:DGQHR domain-containing protein [Actinomycetota bacterium]
MTGVEFSDVAVSKAQHLASARGVHVEPSHGRPHHYAAVTRRAMGATEMPTVEATRQTYNGYTFYAATFKGKVLLESCFVRRRQEQPKRGFQRTLDIRRCREIARYLDADRLSIPTNIIVSAQQVAELRFRSGRLSWSEAKRSFLVLDGQHRLFAMEYVQQDYPLLVAVYAGLSPQQEVRLFTDINTKQKGVPTALLLDIKQLAGTETSDEEMLRQLFDFLSTARSSPLKGLMSSSQARKGMVSRVTFNSAVKPILEGRMLSAAGSVELQQALLANYLSAVDRVLTASGATRNKLTNSTTLHAFMEIFDDVVAMTLERAGRARAADLTQTLEPLADFDFDSYTGSNRPARSRLANDMRAMIAPTPTITDEMV